MVKRREEWGRRRRDNQPYPKTRGREVLPRGLTQVRGTRKKSFVPLDLQPFGPMNNRLVFLAGQLGGNIDTSPDKIDDYYWRYADFESLAKAERFAENARRLGILAIVQMAEKAVYLESGTDPKEGWWGDILPSGHMDIPSPTMNWVKQTSEKFKVGDSWTLAHDPEGANELAESISNHGFDVGLIREGNEYRVTVENPSSGKGVIARGHIDDEDLSYSDSI